MDDARALLDSLMGQTRNAAPKEKRKKGDRGKPGEGFKDDSVCKLWLAGFCPAHEELFYNTRRDLGKCPHTHFEMHKEEFNVHPDREKWLVHYEEQLLNHLGRLVRETKDIAEREKIKYEQFLQKIKEAPSSVKDADVEQFKAQATKLLAEAEMLAEKGDFDGSKRKIAESKIAEEKAKEAEENSGPPDVSERICSLCGERRDTEKKSAFSHESGRVHQGVLLIIKKHRELREREEKGKLKVDRDFINKETDRIERDAKDKRRAKEREEREERAARKEREEREREDRRKEREQREKEVREREARQAREAEEEREREAKHKLEGDAKKEAERKRREADRETAARQGGRRSRSRSRGGGERRDRRGGGGRRERSRSRSRSRDRRGGGGRADTKKEDSGPGESKQALFRARNIEKKFMDMLLGARCTAQDVYEDIEKRCRDKDEWKDCPEHSRRELTASWLSALANM